MSSTSATPEPETSPRERLPTAPVTTVHALVVTYIAALAGLLAAVAALVTAFVAR